MSEGCKIHGPEVFTVLGCHECMVAIERRQAIEECAKVADRLAEMMEAGAGDYPRGRRLRQCGELIRALSTPSPTKSVENSRSVVVEPEYRHDMLIPPDYKRCRMCGETWTLGGRPCSEHPVIEPAAQHKPEGEL